MYSHQHPFSGYAHGHSLEEEHNVHDEPYGYENGDDVSVSYHLTHCSLSNTKAKETTRGSSCLWELFPLPTLPTPISGLIEER